MRATCPRCGTGNPNAARFCRNCGLLLTRGAAGVLGAGRAPHPTPLLSTEPLLVRLFNGGYDLVEVVVRVCSVDRAGGHLAAAEHEIAALPRGGQVTFEVPSYELPDRVRALKVELVKAEFAPSS